MKKTHILSALIILANFTPCLEGKTCLRCQKIEAERAEEQAKHPQKIGYYDDQVDIHSYTNKLSSNESPDDKPKKKGKPSHKENELIGWVNDINSAQQLETRIQSDELHNPGIGEEKRTEERAHARHDELTKENRAMIQKDRSMTKESYDPNEGYGGFRSSNFNKAAPNQEKILEGETPGSHSSYAPQGWE